jgi:SlyX protein
MENRIAEVELRINAAEDTIEELNRTVFRQQQQIDVLQKQLVALAEQVQSMNGPGQRTSLLDEIPPHY